jgi:CheY-like chemotaxis protein
VVRPVLLVVDEEADSLRALSRELDSRYGAQYRVVARASAEDALATLAEFRAEGVAVPMVLADQWMPETTGIDLLARVRELYPTARRGLLVSWGDRSATAPILAAAALGKIDFYVPKPSWSPDEEFHLALTASLGEWWRSGGGLLDGNTESWSTVDRQNRMAILVDGGHGRQHANGQGDFSGGEKHVGPPAGSVLRHAFPTGFGRIGS